MRIVGGEYGGRRVKAPQGRGTRPTPERVREAIFSILADIAGVRVLDLFAGSGALGLEALSRGAAHATFVDNDPAATDTIADNLASLGLEAGARIVADDAISALAGPARFDLVFVDPPYAQAATLGPALALALPAVLSAGARVVGESDRRAPLELGLPLRLERRYGDTLLRIYAVENHD